MKHLELARELITKGVSPDPDLDALRRRISELGHNIGMGSTLAILHTLVMLEWVHANGVPRSVMFEHTLEDYFDGEIDFKTEPTDLEGVSMKDAIVEKLNNEAEARTVPEELFHRRQKNESVGGAFDPQLPMENIPSEETKRDERTSEN